MEIRAIKAGITVYDDFAHHPTAIATTIDGLRRKVGNERIIAILEPRSNTMKMQVHNETLPDSLKQADQVMFYFADDGSGSSAAKFSNTMEQIGDKGQGYTNIEEMMDDILTAARPGDHLLIMSNGGFEGIHQNY